MTDDQGYRATRTLVASALQRPRSKDSFLLLSMDVPVLDSGGTSGLFDLPLGESHIPGLSALFFGEEDTVTIGRGAAWQIQLSSCGEAGLRELRSEAERLFVRMTSETLGKLGVQRRQRIYGGLSFAPHAANQAPWSSFGEGQFVLPRWTYEQRTEGATLTLALAGTEPDGPALAELDRLWEHFVRVEGRKTQPEPQWSNALAKTEEEAAHFATYVRKVLSALQQGTLSKLVAARRSVLELAGSGQRISIILDALRREQPGCMHFALRADRSTFLGATPERLVKRVGTSVYSEALAGTARPVDRAVLSDSAKDRLEHSLVVSEIAEVLRRRCVALEVDKVPSQRHLRDVVHLQTRIFGRLDENKPTHVLSLVGDLHPTPAVGGVPRLLAQRWITENEPMQRGWYAAPIGWFDQAGDGSFYVALRSGVIEDPQESHGRRRVHVYAGAGIVKGSDPLAEYRETALKQRALLSVLGVSLGRDLAGGGSP